MRGPKVHSDELTVTRVGGTGDEKVQHLTRQPEHETCDGVGYIGVVRRRPDGDVGRVDDHEPRSEKRRLRWLMAPTRQALWT